MAWMADDVFTIHHGWLFQYAEELKRRGDQAPVRMHFARRSPEYKGGGDAGGDWMFSSLDRLGERFAEEFSTRWNEA